MKNKEKDIEFLLRTIMSRYSTHYGKEALDDVLAKSKPKEVDYSYFVTLGSLSSKHSLRKYIQGAKLTDEGLLIVFGDDPKPLTDFLPYIVRRLLDSDCLESSLNFDKWSICSRPYEEVSSI